MKIKDYLRAHIIAIDLFIALMLYLNLALWMTGAGTALIGLFTLGLFIIVAAFLFIGWKKNNNRLNELRSRLDRMKDKYLIAETLEKPTNPIEMEYYEMMKAVSKSAIEEVEAAKRRQKEYSEFVDSWVHEIKTPLTACSLIADNGCDRHKLKKELKKADNLTDTVLYYARLGSINKDTQISECSLRTVADNAVKDEMSILIAAMIQVDIEGEGTVYTDNKLVGFIIKQLLVNTAKYCPGATIKITVDGSRLVYEDNGTGIPAHEIPRVTERGFTGARYRNDKGTGMGLYIVSELVKQLNSSMQIESEENRYTRFTFEF